MIENPQIEKEELPVTFRDKLKYEMLVGQRYEDDMNVLSQKLSAGDTSTWTKHFEYLDSRKTHYLRSIEASFNQDVETQAKLNAKYGEIMKQKGLNSTKTAVFYGEVMNLLDSANRRLSVAMQYTSVLALADQTKARFISEILELGIQLKQKQDQDDITTKKVGEVLAMYQKNHPGFTLEALKAEIAETTKQIEQTQTKISALQLEAGAQQDYIGVKTVCDTIQRLEKELARPPNYSEIERNTGIAHDATAKYLKISREKHFVKMSRFGGSQKRYTVTIYPTPSNFNPSPSKTAPEPAPILADRRENQDTVTVDKEKPVKIAQTEGVMDEELEGETNGLSKP